MRDSDTDDTRDDSDIVRPRVPQNMVVTEDEDGGDVDDDLIDTAPLYANPEKLTNRISNNALSSVSLVGPIHAERVVDISATSITLGATYEPNPEDDRVDNVCSLANAAVCSETAGSQKVGTRYIPLRLEFEKTFDFAAEVNSVSDLRDELQDIFAPGISLTESDDTTPPRNPRHSETSEDEHRQY